MEIGIFIKEILVNNPNQRPKLDEILNHPWIIDTVNIYALKIPD